MPNIQRRQVEAIDGMGLASAALTRGSQDSQPAPQPRRLVAEPPDGTQPAGAECLPTSSPPEKNLDLPCPAKPVGFGAHPELIYRRGQPTHRNFRMLPKPAGWRPYHPLAKLSVDDVLAVRASNEPNERLAQLYGIGLGTVRPASSGRHDAAR